MNRRDSLKAGAALSGAVALSYFTWSSVPIMAWSIPHADTVTDVFINGRQLNRGEWRWDQEKSTLYHPACRDDEIDCLAVGWR